jgi:ADP-dependent NAD(P)H-hydrate dehydratase
MPLPPVRDGDKESKGRILIVGGSRETPGAALLAGTSALRVGAGKLRMLVPASIAVPVGVAMPEALVRAFAEAEDGTVAPEAVPDICAEAERATAVVAGPGLMAGGSCRALAAALLATRAKLVLDAALLHALEPAGARPAEPPVLLPHSGELASLLGCDEDEVEADPIGAGRRAAERYGAHVLVKGVVSHVVALDGRLWTHRGGAPGLGASGSGDTLAGIVGGLQARGADGLTALLWGVLLHGEAGAALAERNGPVGFLAREIPGALPALLPR